MSNDSPPLLPCPFCGRAPGLKRTYGAMLTSEHCVARIYCACGIEVKRSDYHSIDDAIAEATKAWNTRASGKTECRPAGADDEIRDGVERDYRRLHGDPPFPRPAGAVPADVREALELAAETFDYYGDLHDAKNTPEGDEKADRNYKLAVKMRAALRGRVVGGAAPGEREAFEAWIRTRPYPDHDKVLVRHSEASELAGRYVYIESDWVAWQARAALTSAAPPPGAAQRPDMAVGLPSSPTTAAARASLSDTVPSTCAHFWDEGETACEHCGAPKP